MTEAAPVLTAGRTKVAAGGLLGVVFLMAGALLNPGGGDTGIAITAAPNPAITARLDAIDYRLTAVEARLEAGHQLAAAVEALKSRLDLLLSGARVQLDNGNPPRRGR